MIVDTLERIERLRRGLVAKRRAVEEAQAELPNAGWNVSAAKRKIVAAEEALVAQVAEIEALEADLPEIRDDGTRWLYGRVAEIRVNRSGYERRVAAAEAAVAEATAEAEKDSWKWKARAASGGGGEPKALTTAREALAAVQKEARAFEEDSAEILAAFDAHSTSVREQSDVAAWAARGYEGERPECIERAARKFAAEMAEGCERLPIPPKSRRKHIFVTAGPAPAEESHPDPIMDPSVEWGTPMTAEEYLNKLVPPPPEPKADEFQPSTKGGMPAWIKRLLEAKKARACLLGPGDARAAVAPVK